MDKKLIGVIVVALVLLAGLALFSQNTPTGAFVSSHKDPLLIGAALSLTGGASSFGVEAQNGISLALDEIKNEGVPLSVKFIFDDTGSLPEKAVTIGQKFIGVDGAKVILTVGANETLALVPVTEAHKVILATPIAGSDDVDGAGKYVFRNRESGVLTSIALSDLLIKKEYKKVALFGSKSSSSSLSYEQSFKTQFGMRGGEVTVFYYDEAMPDVRIGIAKVKAEGIGAVYVISSRDKDGADVVKQLKEMDFLGLIVGRPVFETSKFLEVAKDAAEGVIITSPPVDVSSYRAKEVFEDYKSKYGSNMSFSAANAYDLVMLLNSAAGNCGSDTDCIREYLLAVKDYPGMGGRTTFNPNGGVSKPMSYKIAKDGKFVPYEAS